MAPWGRPPGGVGRRDRRTASYERQMREWEARQRFQELDSDEDEGDGHGVELGPRSHRAGFAGDELAFTGYDIGTGMNNRGSAYDDYVYSEDYDFLDEEDDFEERRGMARQLAMRDKEELLVRRALERIDWARRKGKTNVKLSREELDALERRGLRPQPQPPGQQETPGSRPPAKANTRERKASIGSAAGDKGSKKNQRGFFSTPTSKLKGAKQNQKATSSSEESLSYDKPAATPPGFITPGPSGIPTHTPLGYHTPPGYRYTPSPSRRDSPTHSRSASRQGHTPPASSPYLAYRPARGRYVSQPDNFRPATSSSRGSPTRSLPDDPDWVPRSRSASTTNMPPESFAYQVGSGYAAPVSRAEYFQNRRHVSGPADESYSSPRRVPPGVGMSRTAGSDPALLTRTSSGLSQQMGMDDGSSEDDDEDQGVQVEIVPDERGGYSVRGSAGAGGGGLGGGGTGIGGAAGGRQRRGKR